MDKPEELKKEENFPYFNKIENSTQLLPNDVLADFQHRENITSIQFEEQDGILDKSAEKIQPLHYTLTITDKKSFL